ncbi:thioesterase II family protein [Streptomyces olivaceus]|uniref:thioesterase II family protein n=1 Tax=Streptomyces olivaceus TaxID=47716 RepID=UPI00363F05EA
MTVTALTRMAGTDDPDLDVVVFPGAGAGPASIACWRTLLPLRWRLHAVCFPGRGTRFGDPIGTDPTPLIDEVVTEIQRRITAPVVLFGHSLGAFWALEAAAKLDPVALVTAGAFAPTPGEPIPRIVSTDEDDHEFTKALMIANGITDPGIAEQLAAACVPIMQGDIALAHVWTAPAEPLACPILSYFGTEEQLPDHTWGRLSTTWTEQITIPGDHFFYQSSAFALIDDMASRLEAAQENRRRTVTQ